MATIRTVASRAGVSIKTVSRALNEPKTVAPETRERVLAAARELDFVPDARAREMRSGRSALIGFLSDVVATAPFAGEMIRGVQAELRAAGRTLLIANSEGDPGLEAEYWRTFAAQRAAGTIYATMYHRAVSPEPDGFRGPIVLANCFDPDRRLAAVLPDERGGGRAQAKLLLEAGHRRIAVIGLNPLVRAAGLRLAGFRDAAQEHGVAIAEESVVPGIAGPLADERLVAYEAAAALLDRADRPTAIACGNDRIALQVFAAAAARGLRIPDDLSVVGFDDNRVISEALHPPLTTVALPHFEIGRRAMCLLGERLPGGPASPEPELVACPSVVRRSCGPPPRRSGMAG